MRMAISSAALGNWINVGVLIAAIVYQILTFGHFTRWWELSSFGKNWANDGFCISFKDTLYHTHLLCLYGDVILASGLYLLSHKETRPELVVVSQSCFSIIGHGVAHGFLWYKGNDIDVYDVSKGESGSVWSLMGCAHTAGAALFFFGFMQMLSVGPNWLKILQSLFHGVILTHYCPLILAFSYVNSVIFVNNAASQLHQGLVGLKDEYYPVFAALVSAPIMIVAFAEPLLCDNLLIRYGGHIVFDYSIPLATLGYYFLAKFYMKPRKFAKKQV